VLALPPAITVDATTPEGAVVTYASSANDLVSGSVAVTCAPASGSTFAIGTTTVACSARDSSGNSATGRFAVVVLSPAQMIANLIADATADSFRQALSLLQNALSSVDRNNLSAACSQVTALISQVQAQSGKTLTTAQADELLRQANDVKAALGCN